MPVEPIWCPPEKHWDSMSKSLPPIRHRHRVCRPRPMARVDFALERETAPPRQFGGGTGDSGDRSGGPCRWGSNRTPLLDGSSSFPHPQIPIDDFLRDHESWFYRMGLAAPETPVIGSSKGSGRPSLTFLQAYSLSERAFRRPRSRFPDCSRIGDARGSKSLQPKRR